MILFIKQLIQNPSGSPTLVRCWQWFGKLASSLWSSVSSSDYLLVSRLFQPDRPVSTAPRLVTREIELSQTIVEGCQWLHPQVCGSKLIIVPMRNLLWGIWPRICLFRPCLKKEPFWWMWNKTAGTHVIHKIPDVVQVSHKFTVPEVH